MLLAYAHRLSQRDYAWIVLVGQMDTASSVKLSLAGDAKLWGRNLLCLALLLGDGCVTGKARDSVAAQCQIRHLRSALSEGAGSWEHSWQCQLGSALCGLQEPSNC